MSRVTLSTLAEMMSNGFAQVNTRMDGFEARIAALEAPSAKQKSTGSKKQAPELVEFTKYDGTVVMTTAKRAAAWKKWQEGYKSPEEREASLAEWKTKREGYKPSKELVDAIKADRCSITHKVAKEKFGFVGTKDDLKALKANICK